MKDNRLYVLHILNAIGRIEQFTHGISVRNKLVHEYFGVDLPSVWGVVIIDLPVLKQNMLKLKSEYPQ